MSNLASIIAKIEAKDGGFAKEMDLANARLEKLEKTAQKTSKNTSISAADAVGNIATKLVGVVKWLKDTAFAQAEVIVETYRFAKSIGDSTAAVMELESSMRQLGGSADLIGPALITVGQSLSKSLSDKATASIFTRLKLDADALRKMKPSDAFIAIAEAISQIANPGERAALATQLFGDKAKDLLPILNQGEKGIAALRDRAVEFGQSVNDLEAAKVEQVVLKLDELSQRLEGIGKQLAVKAAMRSWADDIGDYFKIAASVGRAAFINFGIVVIKLFKYIANAAGKLLPTEALRKDAKEAAGFLKGMQGTLEGDVEDEKKYGQGLLDKINGRQEETAAQGAKPAAPREPPGVTNPRFTGQKEAIFDGDRFRRALEIIKELETPLEKLQNKFRDLDEMLKVNALSWEDYAKAVSKSMNELSDTLGDRQISFAGATKKDSTDAYSATIRNQRQGEQYREDPAKRLERLQMAALELQRQQLEQQKRTADALAGARAVRV